MRDCGESFPGSQAEGLHELTWGVVFLFERRAPFAISWDQDSYGNPYRLAVGSATRLLETRSVVPQDVSGLAPWSTYIGQRLKRAKLYTYESNWAREPSVATRHPVAWGLEIVFPSGGFLIASAIHGSFLEDPTVNDELVVAYTPEAVERVRDLREGYREEWGAG